MSLHVTDRALVQSYARYPVTFASGSGCTLVDDEGVEYLDLLAGVGVCNTGHCHPDVVAAVKHQTETLMHVSNLFYTTPMARLAERLADNSLGGRVFFANSGAEANEAAIKLVRKARPGGDVVVLHGAFHGRTYGALSATPQESKQAPFAPLVPGFRPVAAEADAIRAAVDQDTAAVLLEPVQGETGVHPLPDDVMIAAREACDRVGAALVFDEVQCGVGRTGRLWAYEHTDVVPDAMTLAKGLGGGLPIGALVTGPRLSEVYAPGDHGSTFGGNLVVTAAANAVLDIVDQADFLEHVEEMGIRLAEGLRDVPGVRSVRGRGLMLAAEVDGDAPELVRRALLEQRMVINATGPTTVRFLPPLVISEDEVDEAVRRMTALLA